MRGSNARPNPTGAALVPALRNSWATVPRTTATRMYARLSRLMSVRARDARSCEQERRDDAAFLGHQDVVGAARGLQVHGFHADALRRQRLRQARMREALLRPGAEQQDLRPELQDRLEVRFRQGVEAGGAPWQQLLGGDDEAAVAALAVDQHISVSVTGESVQRRGGGGMELHC